MNLLIHDLTTLSVILQMKFWAKVHDVNCPKDRTMSSMAIISLVSFHLQVNLLSYFCLISINLHDHV
jgi:hypothetical protein